MYSTSFSQGLSAHTLLAGRVRIAYLWLPLALSRSQNILTILISTTAPSGGGGPRRTTTRGRAFVRPCKTQSRTSAGNDDTLKYASRDNWHPPATPRLVTGHRWRQSSFWWLSLHFPSKPLQNSIFICLLEPQVKSPSSVLRK